MLATDLVNTAPEVRSSVELLTDPAALAAFLAEHDLTSEAGAELAASDVRAVRRLRSDVRSILQLAEDDLVESANGLVRRAGRGPQLESAGSSQWQWTVVSEPGATIADELAVLVGMGILGTVHALGGDRVRHCAADTCAGMFVDVSRAGRRRYCTPEICGNRLNVANYRARRRHQPTTPG